MEGGPKLHAYAACSAGACSCGLLVLANLLSILAKMIRWRRSCAISGPAPSSAFETHALMAEFRTTRRTAIHSRIFWRRVARIRRCLAGVPIRAHLEFRKDSQSSSSLLLLLVTFYGFTHSLGSHCRTASACAHRSRCLRAASLPGFRGRPVAWCSTTRVIVRPETYSGVV